MQVEEPTFLSLNFKMKISIILWHMPQGNSEIGGVRAVEL